MTTNNLEISPQVLIVESNIAQRRKLIDAVLDTELTRNIREAHSVAEGQELLTNEHYDICFVGAGLSEITQKTFISTVVKEPRAKKCIFIPLCKNPEREKVIEFIQAGANGVLVVPIQTQALKRVIETAFSNKTSSSIKKLTEQEQAQRLTNLLDLVSKRLETLASRLKEENLDMVSTTASSKLIKEILLASCSDLTAENKQIIENLIDLVKQEQNK